MKRYWRLWRSGWRRSTPTRRNSRWRAVWVWIGRLQPLPARYTLWINWRRCSWTLSRVCMVVWCIYTGNIRIELRWELRFWNIKDRVLPLEYRSIADRCRGLRGGSQTRSLFCTWGGCGWIVRGIWCSRSRQHQLILLSKRIHWSWLFGTRLRLWLCQVVVRVLLG